MSKELVADREFLIDISGRYLKYLVAYAKNVLQIPVNDKNLLERELTEKECAKLGAFMDGLREGVKIR